MALDAAPVSQRVLPKVLPPLKAVSPKIKLKGTVRKKPVPVTDVDPRTGPAPDEFRAICDLDTPDLIDMILTFTEALTGKKFYNYQYVFCRRIVESVLENDGEEITGLWSRQSGKTEALADLGFSLCILLPKLAEAFPDDPRLSSYATGFWIGIYAPIASQATISFSRMRKLTTRKETLEIMRDPEVDVRVEVSRGDTVTFSNGSMIEAHSASPDSQIEGKTWHLVMLEESQKLTQTKVEKEIGPMLTSTNGTMVKIGTAWISRGGFHKSIQQNQEILRVTGKRNHFEFPYDLVIAEKNAAYKIDGNPFHLKYEKWIKKQIVKLGGVDSIEFKMNFRCLWNESRLLAVNPEVLRNCAIDTLEMGTPFQGGLRVGGIDIGKVSDSTVVTVIDVDMANPVVNKLRVEGQDDDKQVYYRKCIQDWFVTEGAFEGTDGQYETVAQFILDSGIRVLAVDSTGIGDAFYERLEAMLGTNVILIPCNFAIQNKARYYKYFLQELHAYRLWYPAGPLTRDSEPYRRWIKECEDLDRVQHGLHVTYQHPDGEGYHDDFPDSAALACWAEKLAPTLEMHEMDVSYLGRDGAVHQNLSQLREGGGSRAQRYQGRRSR